MNMELLEIMGVGLLVGLSIPTGGLLARVEHIQPRWLEEEFRHSVGAFGGGVLFSAVALVLVPDGVQGFSIPMVMSLTMLGGVTFQQLDMFLARRDTPASQLVAMLTDFIPEAMAFGAAFTHHRNTGFLLAIMIALQNVPEGFNAYRELSATGTFSGRRLLGGFCLLSLLGPVSGLFGWAVLSQLPSLLNGLMLFASGGILYLIFQDIAPQSKLERHWGPPLGAVAGFLAGLAGHMVLE